MYIADCAGGESAMALSGNTTAGIVMGSVKPRWLPGGKETLADSGDVTCAGSEDGDERDLISIVLVESPGDCEWKRGELWAAAAAEFRRVSSARGGKAMGAGSGVT